jgi:hypothetical protein
MQEAPNGKWAKGRYVCPFCHSRNTVSFSDAYEKLQARVLDETEDDSLSLRLVEICTPPRKPQLRQIYGLGCFYLLALLLIIVTLGAVTDLLYGFLLVLVTLAITITPSIIKIYLQQQQDQTLHHWAMTMRTWNETWVCQRCLESFIPGKAANE